MESVPAGEAYLTLRNDVGTMSMVARRIFGRMLQAEMAVTGQEGFSRG